MPKTVEDTWMWANRMKECLHMLKSAFKATTPLVLEEIEEGGGRFYYFC